MFKEINDISNLVTRDTSNFVQVLEYVYHFDNGWLVKTIIFQSSSDALDFMLRICK